MKTFHLDPTLRFVEPGPIPPAVLAARVGPSYCRSSDSLLTQMRQKAAAWRWFNRKGNTP